MNDMFLFLKALIGQVIALMAQRPTGYIVPAVLDQKRHVRSQKTTKETT